MKRTYASFTVPGFLFPEEEIVQVKTRAIESLRIPDGAYGLSFFDVLITRVANGKKKVQAESDPVNRSPYYKIGTGIYTKNAFANETKRDKKRLGTDALRSRMEMLRCMRSNSKALKARVGGFLQLEKGAFVLLVNGTKKKVVRVQ